MSLPKRFLKPRVLAFTERLAERQGFGLVRRDYYSPFPLDAPRTEWERRSPLPGIEFDVAEQADWFAEATVRASGWTPPDHNMYGPVDAELLYGAMKLINPKRVVELGSGISSEIIREAREKPHEIFDPFPNDRTAQDVHRVSAVDVPLEVFRELQAGDVLFVDTTHTVKTGGDVNRIVLEYLPLLATGVIVHVHDIFLPYEYPYEWKLEGRLWAEQYLLQAFLIGNERWSVLCGAHAVAKEFPDRVAATVPRFTPGVAPGAFWMVSR